MGRPFALAFAASAYAVVIGYPRTDVVTTGAGTNIRTTSLPTVDAVALRFTSLGTTTTRVDPDYFTVAAVGFI